MKIFISHIHENEKLALSLKNWIETSFLGQIEVFVSADPDDIVFGDQWFKEIESFLATTNIVIILANKISVNRRWICFEAGAGWIKKIPVVVVCFGGMIKSKLPPPFSVFQSIELKSHNFSKLLFEAIANHLGYPKAPNINYDLMSKELLKVVDDFFDDDDLGLLDQIQLMNENFQKLIKIVSAYTYETNLLTDETTKFAELLQTEKSTPTQGSASFLQKQSKKFAKKVEVFADLIEGFNNDYQNINNNLSKSLSFIFDYSSLESDEEMAALDTVLLHLDLAIKQASNTSKSINRLTDTIDFFPKYEKYLNRSFNRCSDELNKFSNNIDTNVNILRKTEIQGKLLLKRNDNL